MDYTIDGVIHWLGTSMIPERRKAAMALWQGNACPVCREHIAASAQPGVEYVWWPYVGVAAHPSCAGREQTRQQFERPCP